MWPSRSLLPAASTCHLALTRSPLPDPICSQPFRPPTLPPQVGYLLTRLLAEHPGMGVPVVREIERFIFRCGDGLLIV